MVQIRLSFRKKLLFAMPALLVALVLGEGLLRYLGLQPSVHGLPDRLVRAIPQPDAFGYFSLCDRHMGWRNRTDGNYRAWAFVGVPHSSTDQFGYRNGVGWDATSTEPVVVFVGDSFTFASEVNDDQTGPSEVAKLLAGKKVRVLNAGVRGYSTLQAKRMLAECLEGFPDVRVVVYTHCGNDIEENLVADLHFPAKAPIVQRNATTGEFQEIEVADPVVPWGEAFLAWHPPAPRPRLWRQGVNWCRARSALDHHVLIAYERATGQDLQDEPVEGDPRKTTEDMAQWHEWAIAHDGAESMIHLLAQMKHMCDQHGAAFLVTSVYTGREAETPGECAKWCRAAEVRYVSLVEHFPDAPAEYQAQRRDGCYDAHYGPKGTQAYAAALVPVIQAFLPSPAPPPRKP